MRLFIAVDLDEPVRAAAARLVKRLAKALAAARPAADVRWVEADRMHLTLRFLGEVAEPMATALQTAFTPVMSTPSFDIELAGVGTFPPSGPPRVIWIGLIEGAAQLETLHHEVGTRLKRLRIEDEDRPFRAHLTVGRFRRPGVAVHRRSLSAVAPATIGRCRIDHVTLYQSKLSPKGSVYTALVAPTLA